jgi:hypothetical protein
LSLVLRMEYLSKRESFLTFLVLSCIFSMTDRALQNPLLYHSSSSSLTTHCPLQPVTVNNQHRDSERWYDLSQVLSIALSRWSGHTIIHYTTAGIFFLCVCTEKIGGKSQKEIKKKLEEIRSNWKKITFVNVLQVLPEIRKKV